MRYKPTPGWPFAVYVIKFSNVNGKTGYHVKTCRASDLQTKIQRYQRKIMKRQLAQEYQTLLGVECIHSFEGTQDQIKEWRKRLLANPEVCPCCDVKLGSQKHMVGHYDPWECTDEGETVH